MQNKSCAVIAEPPVCFPWGFDEEDERCAALKLLILNRLSHIQAEGGVTRFYFPIDAGIGLYASEQVVSLLETDKRLRLFSLIPYEEQAVKWSPELRNRYYAVQEHCTKPILISAEWMPTCELDAMLEAIDHASHIVAVGARDQPQDRNYATALRYAQKSGRDIQHITSSELY